VGMSFYSCGGSGEQKPIENHIKKDALIVKNEITEPQENPVISLSKNEAEVRIRKFLKENSKIYADYGGLEGVYLVGGNYTQDGLEDYFYTVDFYPGGDFIYSTHFFYYSEQDEILELKMSKSIEFVKSIDVKEMKQGKLIGEANIWSAFSGEHMASRTVKAEFMIDDKKINCDKKYLSALSKAQKEINVELEQMEQELMENAGAHNFDN